MEISEIVNYIEGEQIAIDKLWYYHAFNYNPKTFQDMINDGIKAKILLGQKGVGFNGLFYISLSREENALYSAYNLLRQRPAFVIDSSLRPIKTRNITREDSYPLCICNSFLPFRSSAYDDEYQCFLKISAAKIKAIRYEFQSTESKRELIEKLIVLKQIILDLENQNKNLTIFDVDTNRVFKKEKVLSLELKK